MRTLPSIAQSILQYVRLRWGKPWLRTSATVIVSLFLLITLSVVLTLRTPGKQGSLTGQVQENTVPDADYPEYDAKGALVHLTHFVNGRAQTRENFTNGTSVSTEEFFYDEDGKIIQTTERNSSNAIIASTSFSMEGDSLVSETGQYDQGNLQGSLTFVYGSDQQPTSSIQKDAGGNVLSQEYYFDRQMTARDVYRNGDLVRERYTYNDDGTSIRSVEQQDAGGNIIGAARFDGNRGIAKDLYANGIKTGGIDFLYGPDNTVASAIVSDATGDPVSVQHFRDGAIAGYDVYSSGEKIESYDYVSNGRSDLIRTTKRNGNGDVLEVYNFQNGKISSRDLYENGLKTASVESTYGPGDAVTAAVYKDAAGQTTAAYYFDQGRATGGDIYENGAKTGTVEYAYSGAGGTATMRDLAGNVLSKEDF